MTGRVQGVLLRASCAKQTQRLAATGWVANRAEDHVGLEVR